MLEQLVSTFQVAMRQICTPPSKVFSSSPVISVSSQVRHRVLRNVLDIEAKAVFILLGHDYPADRDKSCYSTVADQLAHNKHVGGSQANLESFVEMRRQRDSSLGTPKLLHASLQVNLRGGRLPERDEHGRSWLRIPLSGDIP